MEIKKINESELTEILQLAVAGEKKFKEMSDRATIIAEKWRVKSNTIEHNNDENEAIES